MKVEKFRSLIPSGAGRYEWILTSLSGVFFKAEALERSSPKVHQRAANLHIKCCVCWRERERAHSNRGWLVCPQEKSLKMSFSAAKPRSPFTKLTEELFSAFIDFQCVRFAEVYTVKGFQWEGQINLTLTH